MQRVATKLRFVSLMIAVSFLLGASVSFAASQVTNDLKATIEKIVAVVTDDKYKHNKEARRKILREVIGTRFSFEQMGMRALGPDWNERSAEEKKQFVELFSRLLEKNYASKIETYFDEKISYTDEIVKDGHAMVKTQIMHQDEISTVDYKLINLNGQWMVYDFIVEGVSMVRNYRSQFSTIIQKEAYSGLVKRMSAKIEEIEAASAIDEKSDKL